MQSWCAGIPQGSRIPPPVALSADDALAFGDSLQVSDARVRAEVAQGFSLVRGHFRFNALDSGRDVGVDHTVGAPGSPRKRSHALCIR